MSAPNKIWIEPAWAETFARPDGDPAKVAYVPEAIAKATVAAALEAAAQEVDTAGDSAVTEALGQSLCCSGYHCGCQGADVGAYLMHHIRALITPDQHDALAAHVAAEVAKARAEIYAQIEAMPRREELLGGQRTEYVQLHEALAWIGAKP